MINVGDISTLLEPNLRAIFDESFNSFNPPFEFGLFTDVIPSSSASEKFGWYGSIPKMREWLGERQVHRIADGPVYEIAPKKYELTIGVKLEALEDEQYGQIRKRIQQMGLEAAQNDYRMVVDAIEAGTTNLCYDGLPFFSTSHVNAFAGGGVQANYATNVTLTDDNIKAKALVMNGYLDDQGRRMGIDPTHIMVDPSQKWVLFDILRENTGPGRVTPNPLAGLIPIINPFLTTTDWYLLDLRWPMKPISFIDRVAAQFAALEGNSEMGFTRDEWQYGVRRRAGTGYGLWQLMMRVKQSA